MNSFNNNQTDDSATYVGIPEYALIVLNILFCPR